MRILYETKNFREATAQVIAQANRILNEYAQQGFDLTLRQLFYQFVSRGLIPNRQSEYKKLGSIINDARLAGYVDWEHISDRTRNLQSLSHWDDPAHVIENTSRFFHTDLWADQPTHVEVWIEKDALVGVIEPTCRALDVAYFSCRGYTSQSEMWVAGQRLLQPLLDGKNVRILHLGDHDPSGIDMTRDIIDRLRGFLRIDYARAQRDEWNDLDDDAKNDKVRTLMQEVYDRFKVERLALNMDQVDEYDPPPNPAKITDSRAAGYIEEHGYESWELDALEPPVLAALIQDAVEAHMDAEKFEAAVEREKKYRELLVKCSNRWPEIEELLNGQPKEDDE